ncbi:unnamed protein product (macronuclear) [Paramecium tetraurelia]|uniref:CRC domain-containing protein n=1 Tax=Paramecium tetraurelia TaxID=5888 RepID=A0C860_PARTE|nr:uncharacterized protein GSPATT00036108001 [Paramecium tetraurelia]CAK66977.1 unnamed protein product [Paramecium tetraurelia]|eukprot:XP_001434374.1 hypothetical protein (macronuclear) [Paramecium tetraurelia strain d4-2]
MYIKQQLLKQQIPSYQHSDGTCFCSVCLCSKCYCKQKPQQTHYINEPKSIYNIDYDSRRTPIKHSRLPNQNYQGRQKALSLHSVYNDDFDKKQLNKSSLDNIQLPQNNSFNIPFCGCNSYALQYPSKSSMPPQLLKPLNQIQLLPSKLDIKSSYQREHKHYKLDQDKIINFSKITNQRLHTNSKEKNIYLNSSYQEQYKGQTAKRVSQLPIQSTYLPFGLSNQGINLYVSTNKKDYEEQRQYQCEADEKLQQLSNQLLQEH